MVVIYLTPDQEELLKQHASKVNENYFLPYWFKRIEGNKFEVHRLVFLPASMSEDITAK